VTPQDVLDHWFSLDRNAWFAKDPAVDEAIRARFLGLYERARDGGLAAWTEEPRTCLALVIVLDQFPRNLFRGEARAFGTDADAREAAGVLLDRGWDKDLTPLERMFAYLPFEHSESLADQERCLALMKQLADYPETADLPRWAQAHLAVIRRFGRFPHRNVALGRASTPEEEAFLSQPGSRF
jgi:uncharacterized protein (DUF924 family)